MAEISPRRDPFIERLVWLMDNSIPIGRWSIGLDGIIGLIPGVGDFAGAAISLAIVFRAVQAGIPRVAIARMMANIVVDAIIGAIPFAGDMFDFVFKTNQRNLRIYYDELAGKRNDLRHWGFFFALALGTLVVLALPVVALIWALRAIGR